MNREIRFRFRLKQRYDKSNLTVYISLMDYKNGLIRYPIDTNEWEILTVDEFTGLKDKNGKEIYECDKGITDDCQVGFIKWSDKMTGFYFVNDKDQIIIYSSDPWFQNWLESFEIIGNIHEVKNA